MTDADDVLGIGIGIGSRACKEYGEDKPDVLRVGTLTNRRTLCKECRQEDRRQQPPIDPAKPPVNGGFDSRSCVRYPIVMLQQPRTALPTPGARRSRDGHAG